MATPNARGGAVIWGATGALTFNAEGTARTGQNQSASSTNADEVAEIKGPTGKVAILVNIEDIYDVEFELIPSHATVLATAQGYGAMVRKNDKLVTSGFAIADYNGTFRIVDFSTHKTNTGAATLKVKARHNETDFSAAAISL